MKKILVVVTSANQIDSEKSTGLWLSEFAEPFIEFSKQGYEITVASPLGGKTPIDSNSVSADLHQEILDAEKFLANTIKVDEVNAEDYDVIFLPGGHGTMFDLPDNGKLQTLLREFYEAGKIVAAVCHGPAGLVNTKLSDGKFLVEGKRITAFTDSEEKAAGLDSYMPFLLESKLRQAGSNFVTAPDWSDHYEVDGNLITGQNPQSTLSVAKAVIAKLN
ncbi:type 1 glutamine amidotransferase domain-containing protein [Paenibacillus sp. HWE-109]|uniref:type 1 glutamine amidotransferase domain-containing protein n=1 Tax=Paenibacillus sp. HWE-109 TaxID=1306526 RepID=UPI001EDEE8BB|nr:type 1 glutamine amidotransferase domain-containing protein [Paenibacillus sp. HWE-109]UKS28500.1 type 1 glutamine amidotransferase domain-containing protein [Paenibacillus sp. HWE-109]